MLRIRKFIVYATVGVGGVLIWILLIPIGILTILIQFV